ncbi:hypothetical protein DFR24_0669 [Panacagrimonas perspica]|uniref:Uncharacterized protein n=1 Tax=Panacagrimonas perspica TaxID=381431 RepID=A0A4R7PB50_9GAMM|nr:hypothetical protein DFR24_0669 [Panacagrimonas perspica]THD02647.1 hypothetical protein B1810_13975 [Panacagrimonas perspica]
MARGTKAPLYLRPARGLAPPGYAWTEMVCADERAATREFEEFSNMALAYQSLLRAQVAIEMARENTAA